MKSIWALVLLALLAGGPSVAAEPEDSIKAVIADQLAAFGREDVAAAFQHAAPGIQSKFGSAEAFGQMVQRGYPMVWAPARWQWRGMSDGGFGPVQTVMFEDQNGVLWEADYLMRDVDGTWRIGGVQLRRLPGVGS
ncbi:MAG: DUF4864 domain-containing protein [Pseudomonadota bacterium]